MIKPVVKEAMTNSIQGQIYSQGEANLMANIYGWNHCLLHQYRYCIICYTFNHPVFEDTPSNDDILPH